MVISRLAISYNFAFVLVTIAIVAQAILGQLFYKNYLTEMTIILSLMIIILRYFNTLRCLKFSSSVLIVLIIFAGYVIYSFNLDREIYWVTRQAALILYVSSALIGFEYVRHNGLNFNSLPFYQILYFSSLFIQLIHYLVDFDLGHPEYTAYLIYIFSLSGIYYKLRSSIVRVGYLFFSVILIFNINNHLVFTALPLVLFLIMMFIETPKFRFPLLIMSGVIAALAINFVDELYDPNSIWRYLYWKGVIEHSISP